MNAASISRINSITDNAGDSDSDSNSDEIDDYYQPISSVDGNEDDDANNMNINGNHELNGEVIQHNSGSLSNGHDYSAAENGVRSLNLSEDEEERESEDAEEEDEERRGVVMDSAMRRALEADESWRNAPLSSDNAVRVIEAMRGVFIPGTPPDWFHDDRWSHQLQRLRRPPHSTD